MELKTLLVTAHLLGAALGLGGALILDLYLLRLLRGAPIASNDVAFANFVSRFVKGGICLLWASGLLILATAEGGPASVIANPKVQAKIVIVVALTLNGLFIEGKALPLLQRNVGRPLFDRVGELARCSFLLLTSISSVSWAMPFVLGVASELNHVVPATVILSFYLAFVVAAVVVTNTAVLILYRPRSTHASSEDAGVRRERRPAAAVTDAPATDPAGDTSRRATGPAGTIRPLDIVGLQTLLAEKHAA